MTTLVVWRLDRLTRSVTDLKAIAKEREIGLRSLREQIGTTTPGTSQNPRFSDT